MSKRLPNPTPKKLQEFVERWEILPKYPTQERCLNILYSKHFPRNMKLEDVLIKVSSLNDFYSTNIFDSHRVAKHIVDLKIDSAIRNQCTLIVNQIALVKMSNGKIKNFYSFATKYCSHHFPNDYPIYDSYIHKMLNAYKKRDHFARSKNDNLRDYPAFKEIMIEFRSYYGLHNFSLKKIDQFLWQAGKSVFPRNY